MIHLPIDSNGWYGLEVSIRYVNEKRRKKKWIIVEFGAIHAVYVPHDLLAICTHSLVQFVSHTLQVSKLFIVALRLCQI